MGWGGVGFCFLAQDPGVTSRGGGQDTSRIPGKTDSRKRIPGNGFRETNSGKRIPGIRIPGKQNSGKAASGKIKSGKGIVWDTLTT